MAARFFKLGAMMRNELAIAVLIASVAFTPSWGASTAQTAPAVAADSILAPSWRVGAEWRYSDGYGLRVSKAGGGTTLFQRMDAPGQWFSRYGFLRQDARSATATQQTIYRTISPNAGLQLTSSAPLTFQREYLSNGKQQVHATSWSVEGKETITVPAGTFDCWIIVWRTRSLKTNWTGFERWWYSPDVQHYVRLEYKYGETPAASRVLLSYSNVGPQNIPMAANPAVLPAQIAMATPAPGPVQVSTLADLKPAETVRATEAAFVTPPQALDVKPVVASAEKQWAIQIGAFGDEKAAHRELTKYAKRSAEDLSQAKYLVTAFDNAEGKKMYRARFGHFEHAQARDICGRLGDTCLPIKQPKN
jgi:cell division septation protein DedD